MPGPAGPWRRCAGALPHRARPADRPAGGLRAGGDDYLVKPFHFAELVARLRALAKRPRAALEPAGDVHLDPASHSLVTDSATLPLTPTEFRLLAVLLASPGTVVRRRELVRSGWTDGARVHDNTLDQYVARLRRKLADAKAPQTISTARGIGYRYA